jgi:hypothetical protein
MRKGKQERFTGQEGWRVREGTGLFGAGARGMVATGGDLIAAV